MTGRKTTIAKVGINRIREIFSAKAKEKCNNPMMILPLKIGITSAKAAEIKNKIERLTINDIH